MASEFKQQVQDLLKTQHFTTLEDAKPYQLHDAIAKAVMADKTDNWIETETTELKSRKASYLSAEYLIGRLIYNNLLCLGLTEEADEMLKQSGRSLAELEEIEDAALGNGGLGRLAACFLDSAATISVPLNGYGIRYKYGIFKQNIESGFQKEEADNWTKYGDPWSVRRDDIIQKISLGTSDVLAVPYDTPVFGYGSNRIGTLRLWQAEPTVPFDFELFNAQDYDGSVEYKNRTEDISRVLYPNDDDRQGKILRLRQQYFFSSASLKDLIRIHEKAYGDISSFADYNSIQLNDTHPVIAIPELIRILVDEKNFDFEKAFEMAGKVFNYTNHTVMQEALECWDTSIIQEVAPEVLKYITQISDKLLSEHPGNPNLLILDNGKVRMANLAVYVCAHTNGVAALHTQIIKDIVFKDWYSLYPNRFLNMTNGVTQRRWIALCNKELSGLFKELLGSKNWMTDLRELRELERYSEDESILNRILEIKRQKKNELAQYLKDFKDIEVDPTTIFDTQVKRIHEYKRQFLNVLTIIALYFEIKEGNLKDFVPTTFFFGGKSAPGYYRAKGIIKLANTVADLIDADPEVSKYIKVVFVPNYNVSVAEVLIAATEVSEQISTAGTEASGTGNMKFMMNGAVTLGTFDGANVEIVEEAGRANNYIFGAEAPEIESMKGSYNPKVIYDSNPRIKRVMDTLVDGTLDDNGSGMFKNLYDSILEEDRYFLLYDFEDYLKTRITVNEEYKDRLAFAKKCFINIVRSGKFSSDRTIHEYANEIWKVNKEQI